MKMIAMLAAVILMSDSVEGAGGRPNIVVVLSDDMGFSDLGCYGGEVGTPVLDGLAAKGVRFTQFYNGARCCPTRASLLTGLYPHQAGVGHMTDDRGHDGYRGELGRRCVTIAEALRSATSSALVVVIAAFAPPPVRSVSASAVTTPLPLSPDLTAAVIRAAKGA